MVTTTPSGEIVLTLTKSQANMLVTAWLLGAAMATDGPRDVAVLAIADLKSKNEEDIEAISGLMLEVHNKLDGPQIITL